MRKQLKIIYHHHSGYSVQLDSTLLVFDYWRGENDSLALSAQLLPSFLNRFTDVYVFISHSHADHYDPVVFTWQPRLKHVEYILGDDVPLAPDVQDQHRMSPGDTITLSDGLTVRAYPSTDLGVSFHVMLQGLSLFHAGDLNLWHWREESSIAEINAAEDAFNEALREIGTTHFDVCMFPLDPRQGDMFELGAERFIMYNNPSVFMPMHFFEYGYMIKDFARKNSTPHNSVLNITQDGTQIVIDFEQKDSDPKMTLNVNVYEPQLENLPNRNRLDKLESGPFADSDRPVKFD